MQRCVLEALFSSGYGDNNADSFSGDFGAWRDNLRTLSLIGNE
jgi:hypothetical protein